MADTGSKFILFWDIRTGEARYRWRLRDAASETMEWSSIGYTDKSECLADMEFIRKGYPEAPVVDLTITGG